MKKGVLPSTLDAALQIGCQRALTVAKRSWKKEVSFSLDNNFNKDIIQNANNLQIQIVCIFWGVPCGARLILKVKGQKIYVTHFRTYIGAHSRRCDRVIAIFISYLSDYGIVRAFRRK